MVQTPLLAAHHTMGGKAASQRGFTTLPTVAGSALPEFVQAKLSNLCAWLCKVGSLCAVMALSSKGSAEHSNLHSLRGRLVPCKPFWQVYNALQKERSARRRIASIPLQNFIKTEWYELLVYLPAHS